MSHIQRTKEFIATEGYVLLNLDNYSYGTKAYCREDVTPNIIEIKEHDMEYAKSLLDTINEENENLIKEQIFIYLSNNYNLENKVEPIIHE